MAEQLATWGRWLKRGDTFDPEDHRLTQAEWLGASVQIFDAYRRWRSPWWARTMAWGIAVYYAVRSFGGS